MSPTARGDDPGAAAVFIADLCAALQSAERAEEKVRLAANAAVGARALDARLTQIQTSLERIELRLAEVENQLALLTRPGWPV